MADVILSDDKRVCQHCRQNDIPYHNTPMAILTLNLCNIIDLDRFYTKLDEVYKIGRYSDFVKDYMDKMIQRYIINV